MASDVSPISGDAEPLRGLEHLSIEDAYFQAWGKIGGAGRLRRTFSLSAEFWGMIEFQIRKEQPGVSDREVKRLTAKRMYLSDDAAQRLLDQPGSQRMERMEIVDFQETMERIMAILGELGLSFHFTGGVAASFYGDPRFTQDLDLVIQLTVDQPETKELLNRLSSGYLIHQQAAMDAIKGRALFQAIDELSMVKIDFHVGEKIPGELGRSRRREVAPGVVAPLVSKEDAILSKLLWMQLGSHKARHDLKMMLKRPEELDRAILQERAAKLGLHELLVEIEGEI
ncbi:MAG: nucleotidyl transferase AbiEii/AbiGii toxin family protein [Isosphaeraceae bacterium]